MRSFLLILCLSFITVKLSAQRLNKNEYLNRLTEWLSIPNDANYPDQIKENLDWLDRNFTDAGFEVKRLETKGHPLFFAQKAVDKKLPTVLFYMHFDGQPVDSAKWNQESPYLPVIKRLQKGEWVEDKFDPDLISSQRIFARSASDDKGPIMMFLEAHRQLTEQNESLAYNVKVILDSQEEQGSPHLLEAVENNKSLLSSDYFLALDGPMHETLKPTLLFGVRGIVRVTMEVYGPHHSQHSGHFGNYAPNPVFLASKLLSSMKDYEGRVVVDGFYNNIDLDEKTKNLLAEVPDDQAAINSRAGFKTQEKVGANYQESIQFPSLNVSGIRAGWVGDQSRTIVPSSCIVEMDIRTVPESKGSELISSLKKHIEGQGFQILDTRPTKDEKMKYNRPLYFEARELMFPFRTPISSNIGEWLRKSINDDELIQLRISGGSVPLSFFINELDVPTVLVPLVNPDNNQHSPNENLRLDNYFNGIQTIYNLLITPVESN